MIENTIREELAWAAGFFDGEGSIGCYNQTLKNDWKRLVISVTQTDIRPLLRFKAAVNNLGSIPKEHVHKNPNWKPCYRWVCYNLKDTRIVCDLLFPFLCEPKRQQISKAMTDYLTYRQLKADDNTCFRGHENWYYYGNRRECLDCRKLVANMPKEKRKGVLVGVA